MEGHIYWERDLYVIQLPEAYMSTIPKGKSHARDESLYKYKLINPRRMREGYGSRSVCEWVSECVCLLPR